MTQDEIQEAARFAYVRGGTSESLFHILWNSQPSASIGWNREELIAFANAVAAKERERITAMLMYLHNQTSAYHNYYKHAAIEINRKDGEGELI